MNDADATKTDQPIPATPENTNAAGKQVVLEGYLAQIYGDWTRTHKGTPPPLYVDRDGAPIWMNRKERRGRAKQARSRK